MKFVKESLIRASPERVFEFHEQANVLSLLTPPWENTRVIKPAKISEVGAHAIVETKVGPISYQWIAQHTLYDPPHAFEDIQVKGPFKSWRHLHLVVPDKEGAVLRDEIDYDPPFWFLGRILAPVLLQKRLQRLFDYRHDVTRRWCEGKDEG